MTRRRCSHCSNNGHNSRSCSARAGTCGEGVRLFGVRLTDGSIMKKSASMGNLSLHNASSSSAAASPLSGSPDPGRLPNGYLSDDPVPATCSSNRRAKRKKGVPWTEEEHRLFLLGLQKLGKGDWRGIACNYVTTRTPTQVASHAQKYFIRQCNATQRKRRPSLFDMVPEMEDEPTMPDDHFTFLASQALETDDPSAFPSLKLSLTPEYEPMEASLDEKPEETKETTPTQFVESPTMFPTFLPGFWPVPFSLWQSNAAPSEEEENKLIETPHHEVFRPIPVVSKEPVKVDELMGMSQLSIKDHESQDIETSSLFLNLLGGSSRPSAFHASKVGD